MPYGRPPLSPAANASRNGITAALMNIANPPPGRPRLAGLANPSALNTTPPAIGGTPMPQGMPGGNLPQEIMGGGMPQGMGMPPGGMPPGGMPPQAMPPSPQGMTGMTPPAPPGMGNATQPMFGPPAAPKPPMPPQPPGTGQ